MRLNPTSRQGTPEQALVVGSGPNGLAAAIRLAQAGLRVTVREAAGTPGGGARSEELLESGVWHDPCSAVHPMAIASPYFRALSLESDGLEWIHPPVPLAHLLTPGQSVLLHQNLEETARNLGSDGDSWGRLFGRFQIDWESWSRDLLSPMTWPSRPLRMAGFGYLALQPARRLALRHFRNEPAQALFAGLAAHSMLDLSHPASAAIGLVLGAAAHTTGWPLPRGGAASITQALVSRLHELGGELITDDPVHSLHELPDNQPVLLDLTPASLLTLDSGELPRWWIRKLENYKYGPGAFKLDYILSDPVPWKDPQLHQAGTLHLGGTLDDICEAERAPTRGEHTPAPFLLVSQPTLFDDTRTPDQRHTLWVYCHVPNGSTRDLTQQIEDRIEAHAPGFRQTILGRHTRTAAGFEQYNPNYHGGDINGGAATLRQLFHRPVSAISPYDTPLSHLFLCSSATPPGGGVHGMCGFHAAERAIQKFGIR